MGTDFYVPQRSTSFDDGKLPNLTQFSYSLISRIGFMNIENCQPPFNLSLEHDIVLNKFVVRESEDF